LAVRRIFAAPTSIIAGRFIAVAIGNLPGMTAVLKKSGKGNNMKTMHKSQFSVILAVILLGLGGCAEMSSQDKSTAIGAGVGAVGGAVLTGGSAVGTVGGAAVGGVIGHEVGKDK
jgi:osmotically inducible lipoprotein OsmB